AVRGPGARRGAGGGGPAARGGAAAREGRRREAGRGARGGTGRGGGREGGVTHYAARRGSSFRDVRLLWAASLPSRTSKTLFAGRVVRGCGAAMPNGLVPTANAVRPSWRAVTSYAASAERCGK